ncbi:Sensor protein of zinc sigma-54-dependent two-component system [Olavius algarvensis associated proteobacterium Delta 3]|nr:Sensor protein of zinc sigma-54-dependent two-component system [Olavius algarvensis associated proteobacterium Delta 3]
MMKTNHPHHSIWRAVPPWLLIGSAVVLVPIFIYVAAENIRFRNESSIRLLAEKGEALIRSFEAGTRAGMRGDGRRDFRRQRLIVETAQLPDIAYILVTDSGGIILAHNDLARVGEFYGEGIDLDSLTQTSDTQWRTVQLPTGEPVFEVFRRFKPTGPPRHMHRGMKRFRPPPPEPDTAMEPDLQQPRAIFVGLDMTTVEQARKSDIRNSVVTASILLLGGLAGIALLLLLQGYRSTRVSLERVRAFSTSLVEHMPIGLIAADAEERVTSVNPVAQSMLDITSENVAGKSLSDVLPPELEAALKTADARDSAIDLEVECRLPTGRQIPLAVSTADLPDGGIVVLFKDQSEIEQLRKQVLRSQRLATVGQLAAGVAHEVRNPLSSIKGFSTYFKERYRKIPEDQQIADLMIQEADRMDRVVSQLLEFARPVSIRRAELSVPELVGDAIQLVLRKAEDKSLTIDSQIADGLPLLAADADKIRQVLLNLLFNSIDAMESGGSLSVAVMERRARGEIEIRISDTGRGIEATHLPHIFDPYFTTKSSGTGLGLAIAHNIMEAHGGKIRINSQVGEGTQVSLIFPIADL